jgi:hypothetical protein
MLFTQAAKLEPRFCSGDYRPFLATPKLQFPCSFVNIIVRSCLLDFVEGFLIKFSHFIGPLFLPICGSVFDIVWLSLQVGLTNVTYVSTYMFLQPQ